MSDWELLDRIAELEARVEPLQPFKLKILELEATIERVRKMVELLPEEWNVMRDFEEALGDKV